MDEAERYSDPIDAGCARAEQWLADKLAEAQYQLGNAVSAFEAEICNGCSYATKTAWGKKCDSWVECRADVERKDCMLDHQERIRMEKIAGSISF